MNLAGLLFAVIGIAVVIAVVVLFLRLTAPRKQK